MDAIVGLTFREPRWLWLLAALVAVLPFLVWRERVRRFESSRFISERLRGRGNTVREARPWFLTGALAASVIALAGPQYGVTTQKIRVSGATRIIVLDVSESMAAADVGGTRLHAARAIVRVLLENAPDRVAFIVFEATPMVVTPLTSDPAAVATLLDSIGVAETERAGSDLGEAVLGAVELAAAAQPDPVDVVLISDGEHQGGPVDAAITRAEDSGIPVHTIMVGSREGATIPTSRGPKQDADGNAVVTRAADQPLRRIASESGGKFLENPFVGERLARSIAPLAGAGRGGTALVTTPVERYQLPLGLAIVLFFCAGIVNRGAE